MGRFRRPPGGASTLGYPALKRRYFRAHLPGRFSGGSVFSLTCPRAYAVGCTVSPVRGWRFVTGAFFVLALRRHVRGRNRFS